MCGIPGIGGRMGGGAMEETPGGSSSEERDDEVEAVIDAGRAGGGWEKFV